MFELKIAVRRKRGRPVKQWIDVVEENMKERGVVQQDAGDRESWRRKAMKELANPASGKIHQDNDDDDDVCQWLLQNNDVCQWLLQIQQP